MVLGCVNGSILSEMREVTIPLDRVRPHVGSRDPLVYCTLESKLTCRERILNTISGEMNLREESGGFAQGSEGIR